MRIDTNVSALAALSTQAQVHANNIANVNTHRFQASRADLQSGPGDQGVEVAAIQRDTSPGPLVPELGPEQDPDTGRVTNTWQYTEGSNTDLAREFVGLISVQRAFEANVLTIRSQDETSGTVLNLLA